MDSVDEVDVMDETENKVQRSPIAGKSAQRQ
jgi:hypothetical protein